MRSDIKFSDSIVLFTLVSILTFMQFSAFSQNEECQLIKSKSGKIYTVDSFDLICLAQTSSKEKTLVYTFASWCKPCRYKLPSVLQLAKDYDLELFILLIDEENSTAEASAIKYIEQVNEIHNASLKTYILKDENGVSAIKYRKVENEVVKIKYRKFLKRIAFEKFELTEELSKYILIDKSGEVLMVTSWKDRVGKKWKNNTSVIDNKILPLLE